MTVHQKYCGGDEEVGNMTQGREEVNHDILGLEEWSLIPLEIHPGEQRCQRF